MKSILFVCLLIFTLNNESNGLPKIIQNVKSNSILSLKNVDEFVDYVLPLFMSGPRDVAGRAIDTPISKTVKDLKETLTKSSKSNEGWTGFGKRALSYFLTGNKALQNDGKSIDIQLAEKLYEKSPQFLKDTMKAQLDGSVLPVLEKKIEDIIQTIKQKKETLSDTSKNPEGKQLTPFDPLVYGVNALINLFWFTSLNGYFLQNMGLDNLFNPDYDYDYDALENKDKEEEEGSKEAAAEEEGKDEAASGGTQHDTNEVQSSYAHYPGQRMVLHPNKITHPSPNYNYFKLYTPKRKNKLG